MKIMVKMNEKILITLLSLMCSTVLFSQNTVSEKFKDGVKGSVNIIKKADIKTNYKTSSINKITARKDSLLNVYGTFDAARKEGALVPLQKKELIMLPKKK
jgi:hypothetical protein